MINTDSRIDHQLQRMAARKEKVFDILQHLTPGLHHRILHPGQWSLLQIANHLYLSEKFSLAYLRKKMSYPDTIPRYKVSSWKGYYMAWVILNSPYKVKAPPMIDMDKQSEVLDPDTLNQNWNELRREMADYITDTYPQFGHHLVFNHPFAGRMT
ncbi:MAG: DinB family protein, partial [Bacteroidota bacterium]|nr:DinB family protein [Bacteroidota bacterium]